MAKTIDDLVSDLRRERFQIDCVRMKLSRSSDGAELIGSGYIRQNTDHGFQIRIYSEGEFPADKMYASLSSKKMGMLYKDADYFSLVADDITYPRTWTASRISAPGSSRMSGTNGYIIDAYCHDAVLRENSFPLTHKNSLRMQSFDSIKFPCNTRTETTTIVGSRESRDAPFNAAEIISNALHIYFENREGLSVFAQAKEASLLPPELDERVDGRVNEAIWFALGVIPRWAMLSRTDEARTVTHFRNQGKRVIEPIQRPPCQIGIVDQHNSVWRLFDNYLSYVLKDTSRPLHPLSQKVFSVCNTRSSSIQGHALAVSVAVESLLAEFYEDVGSPTPQDCADIDALFRHLCRRKKNPRIIARVKGALDNMKATRALDRLRVLAREAVITPSERHIWQRLRNEGAHGDAGGDLQKLIDMTNKVNGLFNRLVFNIIAYKGMHIDYGKRDCPTVHYPLQTPESVVRDRSFQNPLPQYRKPPKTHRDKRRRFVPVVERRKRNLM